VRRGARRIRRGLGLALAALGLAGFALAVTACGGNDEVERVPTRPAASSPAGAAATVPANVPFALQAAFNDDPKLPGAYVRPNPGPDGRLLTRDDLEHFPNGTRIAICTEQQIARNEIGNCYHSNPPTSGPHALSPALFRVHEAAVPKENLVHNMEHGGVVIWHNTASGKAIALLAEITNESLADGLLVVMSPYPELEPETIALTAWTRLDKFAATGLTPERVRTFIQTHVRRFNPEGF
jgi:hypothetical protein